MRQLLWTNALPSSQELRIGEELENYGELALPPPGPFSILTRTRNQEDEQQKIEVSVCLKVGPNLSNRSHTVNLVFFWNNMTGSLGVMNIVWGDAEMNATHFARFFSVLDTQSRSTSRYLTTCDANPTQPHGFHYGFHRGYRWLQVSRGLSR